MKNRLIEPTLHFQALEKSALICVIRGSMFSVLGKRLRNGMRSYGVAPDSDPVFSKAWNLSYEDTYLPLPCLHHPL